MLRWTKWLLAALAVVMQLFALYRPSGPPGSTLFPGVDKVGHLIIFALPVFLILLALGMSARSASTIGVTPKQSVRSSDHSVRSVNVARGVIITVILIFVAHAVISEIIQGTLYRHRTGDPLDVLADVTGIALGVGIFVWVARRHSRSADDSRADRAMAP